MSQVCPKERRIRSIFYEAVKRFNWSKIPKIKAELNTSSLCKYMQRGFLHMWKLYDMNKCSYIISLQMIFLHMQPESTACASHMQNMQKRVFKFTFSTTEDCLHMLSGVMPIKPTSHSLQGKECFKSWSLQVQHTPAYESKRITTLLNAFSANTEPTHTHLPVRSCVCPLYVEIRWIVMEH